MASAGQRHQDGTQQNFIGTYYIVTVLFDLTAFQTFDPFFFGPPDDEGSSGSQ